MNHLNARIRQNRSICVPFIDCTHYCDIVESPNGFRTSIDSSVEQWPELFPPDIVLGYLMKDIRLSKKLLIPVRRIEILGISYTIRPSFVMPYMTGFVDDVEKGLFLRKFDVPFWALPHVCGKNPMYWFRMEQSLGRNSIVGTTVKKPESLPKHVAADEKHSRILGNKVYVATTAGNGCILGASIAEHADEADLTKAYGTFKEEAQCVHPEYKPETMNTDGWKTTQNAWKTIFSSIIIINCFLHIFIKIRDRAKNKYKNQFLQAANKLWDCYQSQTKTSFAQRVRRLHEWAIKETGIPEVIIGPISKLRQNLSAFSTAYDFPGAHRTSNMIDRLMQRMHRHLFSTQYFHGSLSAAELSIRGWVLINNFAPSNPWTIKKHDGLQCPAERINEFRYHDNWLQNLLISASLQGAQRLPPNPL